MMTNSLRVMVPLVGVGESYLRPRAHDREDRCRFQLFNFWIYRTKSFIRHSAVCPLTLTLSRGERGDEVERGSRYSPRSSEQRCLSPLPPLSRAHWMQIHRIMQPFRYAKLENHRLVTRGVW